MYVYFKYQFDKFNLEKEQKNCIDTVDKFFNFSEEQKKQDYMYFRFYPGVFCIEKTNRQKAPLYNNTIIFGFFIKKQDYCSPFKISFNTDEYFLYPQKEIRGFLYFSIFKNCGLIRKDIYYTISFILNNLEKDIYILSYKFGHNIDNYMKYMENKNTIYDSLEKKTNFPILKWILFNQDCAFKFKKGFFIIKNQMIYQTDSIETRKRSRKFPILKWFNQDCTFNKTRKPLRRSQKFSKEFYNNCIDSILENKVTKIEDPLKIKYKITK